MRAGYSNRPDGGRKGLSPAPPENRSAAVLPPQRSVPPSPDEKARRVDHLRAALAGSAPAFHARARRGGEGRR